MSDRTLNAGLSVIQDVEEILVFCKVPHKYIHLVARGKEGYESSECQFLEMISEPLTQPWPVAPDVPFCDFSLMWRRTQAGMPPKLFLVTREPRQCSQ